MLGSGAAARGLDFGETFVCVGGDATERVAPTLELGAGAGARDVVGDGVGIAGRAEGFSAGLLDIGGEAAAGRGARVGDVGEAAFNFSVTTADGGEDP